jgi:hypothetical protein
MSNVAPSHSTFSPSTPPLMVTSDADVSRRIAAVRPAGHSASPGSDTVTPATRTDTPSSRSVALSVSVPSPSAVAL